MLRVLYLPLGAQTGTCEAWRNVGVQLETFDFYGMHCQNVGQNIINDRFLQKVREFSPQLIHMQLQITNIITAETLQKARELAPGVVITNWSGDIRAMAIHELHSLNRVVDWTLISSTGQLEMYHKIGATNTKYWQIGYDPKMFHPLHYTDFTYDISFAANNYGNQFPDSVVRAGAVNMCRQSFGGRFGLFGGGWGHGRSLDIKDVNEVYNRSICSLSISNFNKVGHYFSDRLLHCLGAGRPVISWYFPGIESYFVEGSEIFVARSNTDIVDLVNFCKAHPDVANQVGINGQKKALKEHCFTAKIIELLHLTGLVDRL